MIFPVLTCPLNAPRRLSDTKLTAWGGVPPGDYTKYAGKTCTILDIVADASLMRPVFRMCLESYCREANLRKTTRVGVTDRNGTELMAACYYDNDKMHHWNRARQAPGMLIAIYNTYQHTFLDGQEGYRIENPEECVVRAQLRMRVCPA